MNRIIGIIIAVIFMSSCSEAQVQNKEEKSKGANQVESQKVINKVVDAKTFQSKTTEEGVQLIDVRTPNEYTQGNIKGSTNMDYFGDNFQNQLNQLDKSKPVLVYCASGGRSGKAAKMMQKMGFMEVYDLRGGFNSWPFK